MADTTRVPPPTHLQYDRSALVGYIAVHQSPDGLTRIEVRRSSHQFALGVTGIACSVCLFAFAAASFFTPWLSAARFLWTIPIIIGIPWLSRSVFLILKSRTPAEFTIDDTAISLHHASARTIERQRWDLDICADLRIERGSFSERYWLTHDVKLVTLYSSTELLFTGTRSEAEFILSTIATAGKFPPTDWVEGGIPTPSRFASLLVTPYPWEVWLVRNPIGHLPVYVFAWVVVLPIFCITLWYHNAFESWRLFTKHLSSALGSGLLTLFLTNGIAMAFNRLRKTYIVHMKYDLTTLQELSYFTPCIVEWPTVSIVAFTARVRGGWFGRFDICAVFLDGREERLLPALRRKHADMALNALRLIHARCIAPPRTAGQSKPPPTPQISPPDRTGEGLSPN